MSSKSATILHKVQQDRSHKDYPKALKRLDDGIKNMPSDPLLYKEAVEISLEVGESHKAVQYIKAAQSKMSAGFEDLRKFATDKVRAYNDPVLCKCLLDIAIKKRDLAEAEEMLGHLKDHTASELLRRTRIKQQSLSTAMGGGYSLRGELIVNFLAEVLLCLRVKRFAEAVKTILHILEEKPIEHEVLVPFLTGISKGKARRGSIIYALGCGHLIAEQYAQSISHLVQGATLSPNFANGAIERLEQLAQNRDAPRDDVTLGLARLYIVKGDYAHAAERLGQILTRGGIPAKVLSLLEAHVSAEHDDLALDYIYIEAAILANRTERALVQIKRIYRDRRRRSDLLSWLDNKMQGPMMPTDVLVQYGVLALDQELYEKSVEVFRDVLAQAPQEAGVVRDALARHRSTKLIDSFFAEIATSSHIARPSDGLGIEHFGNSDFSLNSRREETKRPLPPDRTVETKRPLPGDNAPRPGKQTGDTQPAAGARNDIDSSETLDLIAEASRRGQREKMKELLAFTPRNIGEEIRRKFFLATYYLDGEDPLSALLVLKTVNLNNLCKEERRGFLVTIAHCYRSLSRFDAAHAVYVRIMSEDPGFDAIEAATRMNYQRYIEELESGIPVLEKTTSL